MSQFASNKIGGRAPTGGRGGRGDGGRGDRGGGGGRGFHGGRDGGGGGRGGGNPHLGESPGVSGMARATDSAILAVINPPAHERNRSALAARPSQPGHSAERAGPLIGTKLPTNGSIRVTTNHFRLNPAHCPNTVCHYHIHLYRVGRDGNNRSEDVAAEEDARKTVQVMRTLRDKHPEWTQRATGFAYDGRSALFTTRSLQLTGLNADGLPFHSELVGLPNKDGSESAVVRYRATLTEVGGNVLGAERARAQEIAVLMYGRWDVVLDQPTWNVVNSCVYAGADRGSAVLPLTRDGSLLAKQGWFASLKQCQAGPMLIVDLACCAFLASGGMIELMVKLAGCSTPQELSRLTPRQVQTIDAAIAKLKVKVTHLGFWKTARRLGPAANSPDSAFEHEGKLYTVEKYYAMKAKTDPRYKALKYPHLPTINMGSATKMELYPAELVEVPSGQPRNRMLAADPRLAAEMIKHAAVKPAERLRHIVNHPQSVVQVLRTDPTVAAFGLQDISMAPTVVPATILPPARLQYGRGEVLEPGTKGSWNADYPKKYAFYQSPANPASGAYPYGVVLISGGQPPQGDWQRALADFRTALEEGSQSFGARLHFAAPQKVCRVDLTLIQNAFTDLRRVGVRIVLVVLVADGAYGTVKLVSDQMALPTQCIKWAKLEKAPRGIHYNVLLKMNFKLGGTSHVLASRLPLSAQQAAAKAGCFQSPPASLSWIFDQPCMLVGIDVSHPEPGVQRESMAAVVGSVDGSATKYVAHISAQAGRQEMVGALTEAMGCLFKAFRARNQRMPATVIVYRDGVSEGQYDQVLNQELPRIHEAIALQGSLPDAVRVVVVVCTKGHRTRIVCQEGASDYMNPCPGLVVDSHVTSGSLNEFYLNSHAAIQGTAKPCRYTLLHDELGIKMSELQLLTYWTTFLYVRCNKTVSYATPAYYAHWASKRGKELLGAGASATQLQQISDTCARVESANNMFFL